MTLIRSQSTLLATDSVQSSWNADVYSKFHAYFVRYLTQLSVYTVLFSVFLATPPYSGVRLFEHSSSRQNGYAPRCF